MKRLLSLVVAMMLVAGVIVLPVSAEEAGSILNVAIGGQFTTLDPGLNTEVVNNYAINHMYAHMFELDSDGNVSGQLCESYTISEDGLTYTFTLVQGAMWSDGVEITSNDFLYSYLRALSYGADNAWAINDFVTFIQGAAEYNAAALEAGEAFDCTTADHSGVGIEAPDPHTLVITLKKPCAYLPRLMAANAWTPVREDIAPQHESLWAFDPGYPVSGPYTMVEINENEKCTLTKNSSYFKADSINLDNLNLIVMTDTSAQALAFQTGEVDMALSISSETAIEYQGSENMWIMPRCSNYFIAINSGATGPDWAKDVNVRRALALAIDKATLADVLGGAEFYPVLNGYVPTGVSGVSDDFRAEGDQDGYTLTYDPETAMQLLADAGYTAENPLTVEYKYSNNAMHADVATILQSMWQAIGVNVELVAVESGVFYDQLDQGDFEMSRYGYVASDDAMQYLVLWTTAIQVVPAVDDPAYDQMVDEAGHIADPAEYYTALHAAEDYLCEENVYVIPLFNFTTPILVQSNVSGYTQHGGVIYFGDITVD